MNKLCVFSRNQETYFMKRLSEEVGDVLVFDPWKDSALPQASSYLIRTPGVYGDDRDLDLLKNSQSPVINPVPTHELLRDKDRQFRFLDRRGFHLIDWAMLDDRKGFSLPEKILIKPVRGQGGWGIRVMDRSEFSEWEKTTSDRSWIIQPFLENLREFRLFFCGHEEILLEREGGVAANFRQGGKARVVSLPPELSELGEEIRDVTGARYGAIDLFADGDRYLILEINPVPGIEQLEQLTKVNIIQKILSLTF